MTHKFANDEEFGFKKGDLKSIIEVLKKNANIETAALFGSRAKGNFKNGSDVDLALKGANLDYRTVTRVSYELNEETLMPYHFDVLNYHTLNNQALIEHIDRVGKVIFEAETSAHKK